MFREEINSFVNIAPQCINFQCKDCYLNLREVSGLVFLLREMLGNTCSKPRSKKSIKIIYVINFSKSTNLKGKKFKFQISNLNFEFYYSFWNEKYYLTSQTSLALFMCLDKKNVVKHKLIVQSSKFV